MKARKAHKNIIFGLGKSGISCARYFDRIEKNYTLIDTRAKLANSNQLSQLSHCDRIYFEKFDTGLLANCELLVVSPGIALNHPFIQAALKLNIEVCGDVELFAKACTKPVIAITGSNGKSTVTELTEILLKAAGLRAQKAGNIGLPILDYLNIETNSEEVEIFVLELSSFQLDIVKTLSPEVAVLLNICEDHLDRYSTFDEYVNSKLSIFNRAKKRIFNLDDHLTYPTKLSALDFGFTVDNEKKASDCRVATLSQNFEEANVDFYLDDKLILNSNKLNVAGKHNFSNILACLSILEQLGININEDVLEALNKYQGMSHRFQLVSKLHNCHWINDSKATNVGATIAALDSFDSSEQQRLILIAGGDSKNSDLTPLRTPIENKVDSLILLGKDAQLIADLSSKVKSYFVSNMQQAIAKAKTLIEGLSSSSNRQFPTTVLLSPACASLDMFKNFEDRGEQFIQAIEVQK